MNTICALFGADCLSVTSSLVLASASKLDMVAYLESEGELAGAAVSSVARTAFSTINVRPTLPLFVHVINT